MRGFHDLVRGESSTKEAIFKALKPLLEADTDKTI